MSPSSKQIDVYLEVGKKRTFAGAIDWPGWCRNGRDADEALQTLFEYGPRYARAVRTARLGFKIPADVSVFKMSERVKGSATTDFGATDASLSSDAEPINAPELRRFQAILRACWRAFDASVRSAHGQSLAKGPRGGGRDLDKIINHLLESEGGYLGALGWKLEREEEDDPARLLKHTRKTILEGLAAAARGEIPAKGPRGGVRWTPRYFIRREAWHVLDHAWELEDRLH
jgi:hypothetical protein